MQSREHKDEDGDIDAVGFDAFRKRARVAWWRREIPHGCMQDALAMRRNWVEGVALRARGLELV